MFRCGCMRAWVSRVCACVLTVLFSEVTSCAFDIVKSRLAGKNPRFCLVSDTECFLMLSHMYTSVTKKSPCSHIFAWFQCTGFLLDSICRYWPHNLFLRVEYTSDDADSSLRTSFGKVRCPEGVAEVIYGLQLLEHRRSPRKPKPT